MNLYFSSILPFFVNFVFVVIAENDSEVPVNHDVQLLQEYLRIDTSYPNPNYEAAITWLEIQAKQLELEFHRYDLHGETKETFPVVIMTWPGSDSSLDSFLLYNHMDVVALDKKTWTVEPFGGEIIDNKIYGRGAQDMKSTSVEHLLAIRNLKSKNFKPLRTIHIGFFPDEERGANGIQLFIPTPEFKALKLGFVLDEGLHNDKDILQVFYTQRKLLWVKFTMPGTSAHGSLLIDNTAGEKLQKVLNRMLNLRSQEQLRLKLEKSKTLGDVTTINLNIIEGGIQDNVTPPQLSAVFDIRVTPSWDLNEFMQFLNETCTEAGHDVTYEVLAKNFKTTAEPSTEITPLTWWGKAFQNALEGINLQFTPRIFPAATDGRFLREIGIPVLGMNTIFKSPNLMHAPDEYIHMDDFIQGVNIYTAFVEGLSSARGVKQEVDYNPKDQEKVEPEPNPKGHHEVHPGSKPNQSGTTHGTELKQTKEKPRTSGALNGKISNIQIFLLLTFVISKVILTI